MSPLLLNTLQFLGGFALLLGGAEFLVRGASRLALRLNISPVVIGLTVVAFGTSLPELLVSLIANLQGDQTAQLAIGNVVGSNIANLGLILGVVSILSPMPVERQLLFREYPIMLAVSLVFWGMAWDGTITRLEGGLLTAGILAFTAYSYVTVRELPPEEQLEAVEFTEEVLHVEKDGTPLGILRNLLLVLFGIVALVTGSNWLVDSAQFIARHFGVSELIIGLSLVALGTSLPELATSAVAAIRKEEDIAVGNLVGSNLFNMLAIVGIVALVKPLPAPLTMRTLDFPVMMVVAVLPLLLVLPRPHVMRRWNGAIMLAIYLGYNWWIYNAGRLPV